MKKLIHIMEAVCFAAFLLVTISSCSVNTERFRFHHSGSDTSAEYSGETTAPAETTTTTATTMTTTETTTTDLYEGLMATRVTIQEKCPYGYTFPTSCKTEFTTVMQNPQLPTGCEITALAQTLNYWGFDIDKVDLCDNYLKMDSQGAYSLKSAYLGNPHSRGGMGCDACVLADTANEYFTSIVSDWKAVDLTGVRFENLLYHLAEGRPVVTVVTLRLRDATPKRLSTSANGEDVIFTNLQHCMTMYGYDKDEGIIYTADPLRGNVEYSLEQYKIIYEKMGRQAMTVYGDPKTAGVVNASEEEIEAYIENLKEERAAEKEEILHPSTTATTAATSTETTHTVLRMC